MKITIGILIVIIITLLVVLFGSSSNQYHKSISPDALTWGKAESLDFTMTPLINLQTGTVQEINRIGKCKRIFKNAGLFRCTVEGLDVFGQNGKVVGLGKLDLNNSALEAVNEFVIVYDLFTQGQCQTMKALILLCKKYPYADCPQKLENIDKRRLSAFTIFHKYFSEVKKIEVSNLNKVEKNKAIIKESDKANSDMQKLQSDQSEIVDETLTEIDNNIPFQLK
jgi:hypothetical protein